MSQPLRTLLVRSSAALLLTVSLANAQGASTTPNSPLSNTTNSQSDSRALEGIVSGIKNPEDMVYLKGTKWVLVSTYHEPGPLSYVNIDSPSQGAALMWTSKAEAGRISAKKLSPHGLAARRRSDGRFDVLLVDHGGKEEAVDKLVVDVSGDTPSVVNGQRIRMPNGTSGNAVAFMPDDGFVVTSMFDPTDSTTPQKITDGEPTGGVWRWKSSGEWSHIGPQMSGANGIVVSQDGKHLIVNEWSSRRIVRVSIEGKTEASHAVDFLPDNLRETEDGKILIGGQRTDAGCLFSPKADQQCSRGYIVGVVDPHSLKVDKLIDKDDKQAAEDGFTSATGALAIGNDLWVGSFGGDKIARFKN